VSESRASPDVVVIGASAGGIGPLIRLFELLPTSSPQAYFVAVHLPDAPGSALPQVIGSRTNLPIRFAIDGDPIEPGIVLVAPPGVHLLLVDGQVHTSAGPRENGHRPAIDPLFRSAASVAGPRATGVLLSGALDDGVSGAAAIANAGGRVLVQEPSEALHPSMPLNAIERVPVDAVLPIDGIAGELTSASNGRKRTREALMADPSTHDGPTPGPAEGGDAEMERLDRIGIPSGLTCPGCGGALWEVEENGVPVLRCHIGHVYGIESFSSEQSLALETALWAAVRALEEKQSLLERLSEQSLAAGRDRSAADFRARADEIQARAETVRAVAEAVARAEVEPLEVAEGTRLA
jgi:two-component system, chemotaxis family, protein-glutamate methylesterase/glutaminase